MNETVPTGDVEFRAFLVAYLPLDEGRAMLDLEFSLHGDQVLCLPRELWRPRRRPAEPKSFPTQKTEETPSPDKLADILLGAFSPISGHVLNAPELAEVMRSVSSGMDAKLAEWGENELKKTATRVAREKKLEFGEVQSEFMLQGRRVPLPTFFGMVEFVPKMMTPEEYRDAKLKEKGIG